MYNTKFSLLSLNFAWKQDNNKNFIQTEKEIKIKNNNELKIVFNL